VSETFENFEHTLFEKIGGVFMKRYKIITFILTIAILLSVYAGAKENTVVPDPALVKIDGQYYIQLADYGDGGSCCQIAKYIQFSSMDEMYTRIKNLDFTEEEFDDMCDNFRRTDNGLKILDIDNLYQPKFRADVSLDRIDWYGDGYVTSWSTPDNGSGTFWLYDEEKDLLAWKDERYFSEAFFDRENIDVLDCSESETDEYTRTKRTYMLYNDRGFDKKYIREEYKFVNGNSFCDVMIRYDCGSPANSLLIPEDDQVPAEVHVFAGNGDVYWYNMMYGKDIKSEVYIDWLMSFDVENYIPASATDNNNSN